MKEIFESLHEAIANAAAKIYCTCDKIEIGDGIINGLKPARDVYAALLEQVKINAGLSPKVFQPGAKSQVLISCYGKPREFDVQVIEGCRITVTLRQR